MEWIATFFTGISLFVGTLFGGVSPSIEAESSVTQTATSSEQVQTKAEVKTSAEVATKQSPAATVPVSSKSSTGTDATIKSSMNSLIAFAFIYQDENVTYGKEVTGDCSTLLSSQSVFSDTFVKSSISAVIKANSKEQTCEIYDNGQSFAISAQLAESDGWYCVDSSGFKGVSSTNTLKNSSGGCK